MIFRTSTGYKFEMLLMLTALLGNIEWFRRGFIRSFRFLTSYNNLVAH